MRMRSILLIVFILLVAVLVALNLGEFTRVSMLNLGFTTAAVPLGLLMLAMLALVVLAFVGVLLYMQSANLIETRKYARELATQRELADKAEASRFTELRNYLDTQAAAEQRREAAADSLMLDRLAQQNKLLLDRLDQSDQSLAAQLAQVQGRERAPGIAAGPGHLTRTGP